MRSPKFVLALAAIMAIGTLAAAAAQASRRMVPVSQTINEMLRSHENARLENDRRCADGADASECAGSEERAGRAHDDVVREIDALIARPAERRRKAEEAIRRFRGAADLRLSYVATSSNPYRDDERLIEIYTDDQGYEHWIDPANDVLVQSGPGAGLHPAAYKARPDARLPVPELRRLATEAVTSQIPDFPTRRSSLHPLEDNKDREIYFFRWDDFSSPARESEMPPFVQVGVAADGRIVSYTDTLTR